MTDPALLLPVDITTALVAHVRHYGELDVETGALLMTRPADHAVTVLALTGSAGIGRRRDQFTITMTALDAAFTYAEDLGLQVRAMIHSHRGPAIMSAIDRKGGLNVAGFTSAIIPDYLDPPTDPARWGWWRHDGGWRPTAPALVAAYASVPNVHKQVLVFDEEGIGEH